MAKKAEDPNQKQSFPQELLDQSPSERLTYFKSYTVAHPFLERANKEIWDALQEPGGALMIFIVGPTGVGKTTLWEHINQRLTQAAQARMLLDPDHMPVVNLYAMAPSSRQFRWPDFYTRALMTVSEPLIDYKVDSQAVIPVYNEKMRRHVPPQLVGDAAMLQRSWEQVLKYRKPDAIFVDEAQHLAKTASGSRLIDQLDHVKSLAVATRTMHVLAGTYELLVFRNLNAQLSRRSIDVHLPRYRADVKDERLAFQKILLTFQRQLPLEDAPDLVHQWKICYAHTMGCVGLLKDWLAKALREAVESGERTISPTLLLKHAASVDRCHQIITDIEEGERSLNADPQATERLMERLGLNTRTRRTKESPSENEEEEEPPKKKAPSPRRRVGQRNPTRDEVKKEATGDE
jgi:energy-coupling factor transporter ATP-binding protein EcfA2